MLKTRCIYAKRNKHIGIVMSILLFVFFTAGKTPGYKMNFYQTPMTQDDSIIYYKREINITMELIRIHLNNVKIK